MNKLKLLPLTSLSRWLPITHNYLEVTVPQLIMILFTSMLLLAHFIDNLKLASVKTQVTHDA